MRTSRAILPVLWTIGIAPVATAQADPIDLVRRADQARVELIYQVAPATVCVFDAQQRGGGSGVLIDADGYGLTNYHVVADLMTTRKGWAGLGDGILYELHVLGVDVTGDVAMFRLEPPRKPFTFPHAPLGDSDKVQLGDPVLALGNPFSLSDDYFPTATMGIVTGVHRYQKGFRGNLVYTDCIQTDASINPGNSGGPLFNMAGEVIGINGRISVNTRGRFNVGFGYAISANQIRRFIPAMRAGLLARHGSLEATVATNDDGVVVFDQMRREGAAYRAGLRVGDRLLSLDGIPIESANQATSLLGTYPEHWPVLVKFRRDAAEYETIVRLDVLEPKLRMPFEPDPLTMLAHVHRLFERHHVTAQFTPPSDGERRYRITRTARDAAARPTEEFLLILPGEGPARLTRVTESASTGRILEFDASSARQRAGADAEAFEVPPLEGLTLSATYIALVDLQKPLDDLDVSRLSHRGADANVPLVACARTQPWKTDSGSLSPEWNPQPLEVLEWRVGESGLALLQFRPDSFELVRIVARDTLTGGEVVLSFDGRLPSPAGESLTIDVEGPGLRFQDVLSLPAD